MNVRKSALFFICIAFALHISPVYAISESPWWNVQSIDTMKYSRDLTREKMGDASFDAVIDSQIAAIAKTGATYVAIATPYDEKFVSMLTRWVNAARKYNLKVWYRGNFSGWEKWFDFPRMTRDEHLQLTKTFIKAHTELFEDGDIFTPCPECENGGPGDPRQTGDIEGHRLFLIASHTAATQAFRDIGKGVQVGYFSMNYDVAKAIMDKRTTEALGGIVTIDHYIKSAAQIAKDARDIAEQSGGKVFIGEFGAPLPDLHGDMTEEDQANWIKEALDALAREPSVIGVNYWVNVGGSAQLWKSDGTPTKAVSTLTAAYSPRTIMGYARNQYGGPIANVEVATNHRKILTGADGYFFLPLLPEDTELTISFENYPITKKQITPDETQIDIVIETHPRNFWEAILAYFKNLFSK